jgi:hypothetical protein
VVIPHELVEEVRQARIEILHRPDRSLVTVVEVLSPVNKVGEGFAEFCAKRQAILRQGVHLVELDLLIGGRRLPLAQPLPAGDYYVMISRSDNRPNCEVYPWTVRQVMPAIPIPLRNPDPDVHVGLGQVLDAAYARGRYAPSLPYHKPPRARLKKEDNSGPAKGRPRWGSRDYSSLPTEEKLMPGAPAIVSHGGVLQNPAMTYSRCVRPPSRRSEAEVSLVSMAPSAPPLSVRSRSHATALPICSRSCTSR